MTPPPSQQPGQQPPPVPVSLLAALHQHHVDHVVVGGLAAVLQGSYRPTRNTDIVPARTADNLDRLVGMLQHAHGRVWTPDYGRPIDVRFDARSLAAIGYLRTRTDHGDLNLVWDPPGLPGGYREILERAATVSLGQIPVSVAAPIDLIRSAVSLDRAKDRQALPGLWTLHRLTEQPDLTEQRNRPDWTLDRPPEPPPKPPPDPLGTDPIHQALAASDQLAVLFEHVRPAVACVRRQLRSAVDDASYDRPTALVDRRVFLARRATMDALEKLAEVRAHLQPGLSAADLHDAPVVHGNHTLAPNLAYQAEDRMMMTMQALGDAARVDDPDQLRTALTEARLHISAADGHLDLMELHLEQVARQIPPLRPPTRPHLELDLD